MRKQGVCNMQTSKRWVIALLSSCVSAFTYTALPTLDEHHKKAMKVEHAPHMSSAEHQATMMPSESAQTARGTSNDAQLVAEHHDEHAPKSTIEGSAVVPVIHKQTVVEHNALGVSQEQA